MMKKFDLKERFLNVVHAQKFCCVCFASDAVMFNFDDCIVISQQDRDHETSMGFIVETLFGDQAPQLLSSRNICATCKNYTVMSYTFIENTKWIAKAFGNLVQQLNGRVEDITKMLETSDDYADTLIVLNNPSDTGFSKIEQINTEPHELLHKEIKDHTNTSDNCNKIFATKQGSVRLGSKSLPRAYKKGKQLRKGKNVGNQDCTDCNEKYCEHRRYLHSFATQRDAGSKSVQCPDCNYVCYKKITLISHVNKVHLKCFNYKCEECDKPLHSTLDYKRHLARYHRKHYSCKYCEKKFVYKNNLTKHITVCRQDRLYKCNQCEVSAATKEKLIIHMKKHANPFPCPVCNQVFSAQGYLNHHIMRVHNSTTNTPKAIYNYRCYVCNENFTNGTERALHMLQHGPHEKPKCTYCKKQFETIKERRRHISNCKSNLKPSFRHKCEYCDFVSGNPHNMEGHVNRYHLKVAPYGCDKCEKRFTNRARLSEHNKTHRDVKTHICTMCDSQFRGPTALKKHMRLHTGEKPNLCEICGEGFISASVRNLHVLKKHTGKNVQCPLCDSKFYTLPLMRSHFKNVHWKLKGERFDVRKVKGLKEEHYDLFRDRRLISLK